MSGTILLVDDEESIASVVRAYLERDGFRVIAVGTGADALAAVERDPPQLVVLDLGLPDLDGFEVCRRIRSGSRVPIIMLTARGDEEDRVIGLDAGADDYVAKPFSARELVARVKAVLRRTEEDGGGDVLSLGDVVLHRGAREVTVAGVPVALRAKEFELLAYLLEHAGRVVSRDQLLDHVWGFASAGRTRTVDMHVASLRAKLDRPELIHTLRGAGYKAVAP